MDPADVRRLSLSVGFDHVSASQWNTAEWLFPAARACFVRTEAKFDTSGLMFFFMEIVIEERLSEAAMLYCN